VLGKEVWSSSPLLVLLLLVLVLLLALLLLPPPPLLLLSRPSISCHSLLSAWASLQSTPRRE
jgi:hypothetical protein